ncbi:SM-20-related protein [Catalinimonas alkaloidigena]|uniref:2OG-Fe(II) oxygenase n=1 Tax=Catalinimonas alkaloidigena TaxID=1075417 RepID=UPI002404AD30|nr:2OG-Fe(II) oxygenase [Catalinimonas alkaloidigena]MDF9800416.1 SM-20-related protein [Catalinimonas alkaloidigena]
MEEKSEALLQEAQLEQLVDQLAENGYGLIDHFFSPDEVNAVINRFQDLSEEGKFKKAGIGKMQNFAVDKSVRGDYIRWINPNDMMEVTANYVGKMRQLMEYLNYTCFLGLKDFEAHFAMYPAGTFYKRHVDRFHQKPHRVISTVCYLNENWKEKDGGQLRMFLPDEEFDIAPLSGRMVCFRSEIEHEVQLTSRPRYSITGWMLDQHSSLTFL